MRLGGARARELGARAAVAAEQLAEEVPLATSPTQEIPLATTPSEGGVCASCGQVSPLHRLPYYAPIPCCTPLLATPPYLPRRSRKRTCARGGSSWERWRRRRRRAQRRARRRRGRRSRRLMRRGWRACRRLASFDLSPSLLFLISLLNLLLHLLLLHTHPPPSPPLPPPPPPPPPNRRGSPSSREMTKPQWARW